MRFLNITVFSIPFRLVQKVPNPAGSGSRTLHEIAVLLAPPSCLIAAAGISTSGLGALTTTPPPRPRLAGGAGGVCGDSARSLGEAEPGVARKALKALWKSDMCGPLPVKKCKYVKKIYIAWLSKELKTALLVIHQYSVQIRKFRLASKPPDPDPQHY